MTNLSIFSTRSSLREAIVSKMKPGSNVGFVPTMGALHEGHLALIQRAHKENELVVVSIFVNPTQFNNSLDLEKYPRMLEKDAEKLEELGFQILLFAPSVEEVYPFNDSYNPIELSGLDQVMEGKYRPGHFQGVVHVVRNLFQIVVPSNAYFGQKDFQQLAIIRHMTRVLQFNINIVGCDTLRQSNGLAMSSRNLRLNEQQKEDALILFKTLEYIKNHKGSFGPNELRSLAIEFFQKSVLELEYLDIVDATNLSPLQDEWSKQSVCCIAAFCGDVRLIDNMLL
ncbi:MAG: pantoate--beta-alanine ligase [Flavobacteriia bacterium]